MPVGETDAVRHTRASGRNSLLSRIWWCGCAPMLATIRSVPKRTKRPRQIRWDADLPPEATLIQAVPSSTFCSDQAFGSLLVSEMRFAVSAKGWRSLRMAETISGARKLSLRIRVK